MIDHHHNNKKRSFSSLSPNDEPNQRQQPVIKEQKMSHHHHQHDHTHTSIALKLAPVLIHIARYFTNDVHFIMLDLCLVCRSWTMAIARFATFGPNDSLSFNIWREIYRQYFFLYADFDGKAHHVNSADNSFEKIIDYISSRCNHEETRSEIRKHLLQSRSIRYERSRFLNVKCNWSESFQVRYRTSKDSCAHRKNNLMNYIAGLCDVSSSPTSNENSSSHHRSSSSRSGYHRELLSSKSQSNALLLSTGNNNNNSMTTTTTMNETAVDRLNDNWDTIRQMFREFDQLDQYESLMAQNFENEPCLFYDPRSVVITLASHVLKGSNGTGDNRFEYQLFSNFVPKGFEVVILESMSNFVVSFQLLVNNSCLAFRTSDETGRGVLSINRTNTALLLCQVLVGRSKDSVLRQCLVSKKCLIWLIYELIGPFRGSLFLSAQSLLHDNSVSFVDE